MEILLKRIYEESLPTDGCRCLLDRLWPRGESKEKAAIDIWAKEIAPSTELRQWFHAHLAQFDEFEAKYTAELQNNEQLPAFLDKISKQERVTLLSASKEIKNSHLSVFKKFLER